MLFSFVKVLEGNAQINCPTSSLVLVQVIEMRRKTQPNVYCTSISDFKIPQKEITFLTSKRSVCLQGDIWPRAKCRTCRVVPLIAVIASFFPIHSQLKVNCEVTSYWLKYSRALLAVVALLAICTTSTTFLPCTAFRGLVVAWGGKLQFGDQTSHTRCCWFLPLTTHHTAPHSTTLHYIAPHCTAPHQTTLHHTGLHHTASRHTSTYLTKLLSTLLLLTT